jgi:hypothetical protein
MQTLMKATVLGLGLLTSGTALANDNFGGSPLYNPRYNYYAPSYSYSSYPGYWNYNTGYPNYYYPGYSYAYGYPTYGWYPGTPYGYWDPTITAHPYSSSNPNWIPYVGWR